MFRDKIHTWFSSQDLKPIPESADYRAWRVCFILKRFWLGSWLAIFCYGVMAIARFYNLFFCEQFLHEFSRIWGDFNLLERFRTLTINNSELRFTIQDTGVGIPQDQQEQLFDLYVRGENARYMPGLGLGLYVCQQIITAHGGKIGVISQPGKGSTFWLTIPI
jgi:Histidine kinase-, DNA gyrase B-, and HSP90-like ATPase